MFCPKCGAEYREEYTFCPECRCALTDAPAADAEPVPEEREKKLCSASDDFEAQIILAKLKADGIYAFVKYRGTDSYNKILLGRTVLGVDIFVGESDYGTALEIINS